MNNVVLRASWQACAILIGLAVSSWTAEARSLQRFRGSTVIQRKPTADEPIVTCGKAFEIVDSSPITIEEKADCLCEEDKFWHWETKECLDKGDEGYECGFFPADIHPFICKPGLVCEKLDGNTVHYYHEGATAGSCVPCEGDECSKVQARQCTKEYAISGEACVTIRVSLTGEGASLLSVKHGSAAPKAALIATHSANGVEVKKGFSNASALTGVFARGLGKGKGADEVVGKACVDVSEVMAEVGIGSQERVGATWAGKVVAQGDVMAHSAAMAKACAQVHEGVATTTLTDATTGAASTATATTAAPAGSTAATTATVATTSVSPIATTASVEEASSTTASAASSSTASAASSSTASAASSTTAAASTTDAVSSTTASTASSTAASNAASTTATTMPQVPVASPTKVPMVQPASEPGVVHPRKIPTNEVAETLP